MSNITQIIKMREISDLEAFKKCRPKTLDECLSTIHNYGGLLFRFESLGMDDMVDKIENVLYHLRYMYYKLGNVRDDESIPFCLVYENQHPELVFHPPNETSQVEPSAPELSVVYDPPACDDLCQCSQCQFIDERLNCDSDTSAVLHEPIVVDDSYVEPASVIVPKADAPYAVRKNKRRRRKRTKQLCSSDSVHIMVEDEGVLTSTQTEEAEDQSQPSCLKDYVKNFTVGELTEQTSRIHHLMYPDLSVWGEIDPGLFLSPLCVELYNYRAVKCLGDVDISMLSHYFKPGDVYQCRDGLLLRKNIAEKPRLKTLYNASKSGLARNLLDKLGCMDPRKAFDPKSSTRMCALL